MRVSAPGGGEAISLVEEEITSFAPLTRNDRRLVRGGLEMSSRLLRQAQRKHFDFAQYKRFDGTLRSVVLGSRKSEPRLPQF